MGSLSGVLQRPFAAVAAVVAAAMSADVPDKLHTRNVPIIRYAASQSVLAQPLSLSNETVSICQSSTSSSASKLSYVSVFTPLKLSSTRKFPYLSTILANDGKMLCHQFVTSPLSNGSIGHSVYSIAGNRSSFSLLSPLSKSVLTHSNLPFSSSLYKHFHKHSFFDSVPIFFMLYKSANLSIGLPNSFLSYQNSYLTSASSPLKYSDSLPPSRCLHTWHLPKPGTYGIIDGQSEHKKPAIAVVLLGWLGSKQKHLKRYADWYTSRGIHAITFTIPMRDIVSYKTGGKADQYLDLLVNHLVHWMSEDDKDSTEKYLIFHTFSNTGWLTYGVILEKFLARDHALMDKIKGCVVDSAPVATPDPQVWASGFSAAMLKKQSVATKGVLKGNQGNEEAVNFKQAPSSEPKPAVAETALLVMLEKIFRVFLKLPTVERRLSDVLGLLSNQQPLCPQLYIYSSADRVIPAESVESFIEQQRKAGHKVRACNFVLSPHVDHFRNFPDLYSTQLSSFLEECLPQHRSH
eukprot:Gb_14347 [translate_table: standard]